MLPTLCRALLELPHHVITEEISKNPAGKEGELQQVTAVVGSRASVSDTTLKVFAPCLEFPHLSDGCGDQPVKDDMHKTPGITYPALRCVALLT